MNTAIAAGHNVVVTDAEGEEHVFTALSGVETDGHSFPVVWVERERYDGDTDRVPWPAEAVRPVAGSIPAPRDR